MRRSDPQSPVHCSHVPSPISELNADVPKMYDRYAEMLNVYEVHNAIDPHTHLIVERDSIKGYRFTWLNCYTKEIMAEARS